MLINRTTTQPTRLSQAIALALLGTPLFPAAGLAQEEENAAPAAEEVTVTGSRIRTSGMESPNPVTVVTLEEIEMLNPVNVIEGLAELPQFNGSYTGENFGRRFLTSSPGTGTLSLRGLQGKSTLTLLDGRRVVSSTIWGGPNANLFPTQLLRSVESVTGGATAVYGTDAVAGAVNFILNTNYEGMRANFRSGISERGQGENYGFEVSGGRALTEKTHLLMSFSTSRTEPEVGLDNVHWYSGTQYLPNPDPNAGNSKDNARLIPYPDVVPTDYSFDGVIHFPTHKEMGLYAVDPQGNAAQFGPVVEYRNNDPLDPQDHTRMNGGSGDVPAQYTHQVSRFMENENYYLYLDHELADNLNVFGQAMYGTSANRSLDNSGLNLTSNADSYFGDYFGLPFGDAPRMFSGNPYLPANIQQMMTDNDIPYIQVGKQAHPDDLGYAWQGQETETLSLTAGFQYDIRSEGFFRDWRVKGSVQTGRSDANWYQSGNLREDRYYRALDAVVNSEGEIVCRSTLPQYASNPVNVNYQDCVPYNPLGRGNASPEAVDWVTGYDPGVAYGVDGYYVNNDGEYEPMYYEYISDGNKSRIIDITEDIIEFTADGIVHGGIGAGPISMATGYSWRQEEFQQMVKGGGVNPSGDPTVFVSSYPNGGNGLRGQPYYLPTTNEDLKDSKLPFAKGAFDVQEAFMEYRIPLLADKPFIDSLNLGASARWADYEGIGEFWSWKLGSDWRLNDELRLRATLSQDIRAPSMGERFDRRGGSTRVTDYGQDVDGNTAYRISYSSQGGTELGTEEAKTYTAGLIYQPNWLEGLQFSTDWYWIRIDDVISQLGVQATVNGCYGYDEPQQISLCDSIIRQPSDDGSLGPITMIFNPYTNQEYTENRGVDFELSYRTGVTIFGGRENVSVRLLGSYMRSQVYNITGDNPQEFVGTYWPAWSANINASYSRDAFSTSLSTSYRGQLPSTFYNQTPGVWDVANADRRNDMMVNGRMGYRFNLGRDYSVNVGLNVTNLFDKSPAPYYLSSLGVSGDLMGRRYSLSVNFSTR